MNSQEAKRLMNNPGYLTPRQYRSVLEEACGDVRDYPNPLIIDIDGKKFYVRACKRIVGKTMYYDDHEAIKHGGLKV